MLLVVCVRACVRLHARTRARASSRWCSRSRARARVRARAHARARSRTCVGVDADVRVRMTVRSCMDSLILLAGKAIYSSRCLLPTGQNFSELTLYFILNACLVQTCILGLPIALKG